MELYGTYDVLIVGAGPGGCSAAHHLAPSGLKVLVVDKARFPREKICGDGITPRCVHNLYRMGLREQFEGRWQRIAGIRYYSTHGGRAEAHYPMGSSYPDHGYVVPRRELDRILTDHVRELDVELLEECEVKKVLRGPGETVEGVTASLAGREVQISARYYIGADGPYPVLGKALGLTEHDPDHLGISIRAYMRGVKDLDDHIEIYPEDAVLPACGWIFPSGDGTANVGVGAMLYRMESGKMNLNRVFQAFLKETRYASAKLAGAELLDRPRGGVMRVGLPPGKQLRGNVVLVGDAAGMTNPFSGEGITYALESGRWAAGAVRSAAQGGGDDALKVYPQMLTEMYSHYFGRGLASIKRGTRPWFIDPLIFAAAHNQRVCDKMSRYLLNTRSEEIPR